MWNVHAYFNIAFSVFYPSAVSSSCRGSCQFVCRVSTLNLPISSRVFCLREVFKTFISLFSARPCDLIKAIVKQLARIMLSSVNDEVYPTASINRTNNGRWRTFHFKFRFWIFPSAVTLISRWPMLIRTKRFQCKSWPCKRSVQKHDIFVPL